MKSATDRIAGRLVLIAQAIFCLTIATSLAPLAPLAAGDPFADGTVKKTLTTGERDLLRQFSDTSRSRLERAKEKAAGKDLRTMGKIYFDAVKRVVIDSYGLRGRPETLMRIALNQAMELTYGLPNADGTGTREPGILVGSSNQDLLTIILADSIALALRYYQSDVQAIDTGSLLDLPYADLAFHRLKLARKWLASVLETARAARFAREALQQWLDTMLIEDDSHQEKFAAEILRAQEALDLESASRAEELRRLRGEMKKLQAELAAKPEIAATAQLGPSDPTPDHVTNQELRSFLDSATRKSSPSLINDSIATFAHVKRSQLKPDQVFALISRLVDYVDKKGEFQPNDDDETAFEILGEQLAYEILHWSPRDIARFPTTQMNYYQVNELIEQYHSTRCWALAPGDTSLLLGALENAGGRLLEDDYFDDDETAARMRAFLRGC